MVDILPDLRSRILDEAAIADQLETWNGYPAVFTRRPVPDCGYPLIIINQPTNAVDFDALNASRLELGIPIVAYGQKGPAGSENDQTREIDAMGWNLRTLFHRQKFDIESDDYRIIDVRATGPIPAPTDDDVTVARAVSLRIRLGRN